MTDSALVRALGGSPLAVFARLLAVSLLAGAVMSWLGVDALDLADDLRRGLLHLYGTGFAAVRDLGRTALAGAALVVPVWFVLRLLSFRAPGFRPRPRRPADAAAEAVRWTNPERARD